MSDSFETLLQPTRLLCPRDSPGKDTGAGCHFLLQKLFLTQGSNLRLLHCRWILYHLRHQGSPSEFFQSFISSQLRTFTHQFLLSFYILLQLFVDMFYLGLSGSEGKESVCNAGDLGSTPGSGRSPWRREWLPTPVFLPGIFHEQRSLWATVHRVTKSWIRLSD